jgi:hypothetical protein
VARARRFSYHLHGAKIALIGWPGAGDLFIAILDGFLVYAAAVGGNELGMKASQSRRAVSSRKNRGVVGTMQTVQDPGFYRPWL